MDQLTAEHIPFVHPILMVQFSLLFKIMLMHGLVPDSFGYSIIISLNLDVDRTTSGNYREITFNPVIYISKLFELVLMIIFEKYLQPNCLQF